MKKTNDRKLGDVIKEVIRTYNFEDKLTETQIAGLWTEITGTMISRHTESLKLKSGKLFIKLDSAVLKNELMYAKSKLIQVLNDTIGKEVIKEIVFL